MDWAKVLSRTPLPTVLVESPYWLMIAAAGGLNWEHNLKLLLDLGGRIGLGLLGVVLCSVGVHMQFPSGTHTTLAALPELTMICLLPPDQPDGRKPWYEIGD